MRKIMLLAAVLALATTACRIETNAAIDINADQSGSLAIEIGFDEAAATALGAAGLPTSGDALAAGAGLDEAEGAEVTTENRGDMEFVVITVPLDDVTQAGGALSQAANSPLSTLDIEFTDDSVAVTASGSLNEAFSDMGGTEGIEQMLPPDQAGSLAEAFTSNVRITFPGSIVEHNADSVDGTTLTWNVPFNGAVDIQAESLLSGGGADDGGGFPIWVLVLIVVVVIGAVAFFVLRGRSPAPAAAGGAAAPTGDTTPPPPPAE